MKLEIILPDKVSEDMMNSVAIRFGWTPTIKGVSEDNTKEIDINNPCSYEEFFLKSVQAFIRDSAISTKLQMEADKAALALKESILTDYTVEVNIIDKK